jgi:hypothetical protein
VERKIALLIPVYNDPEGLRRSLESLPPEVPLDVVVVDDGSDPPLPPPEVPRRTGPSSCVWRGTGGSWEPSTRASGSSWRGATPT